MAQTKKAVSSKQKQRPAVQHAGVDAVLTSLKQLATKATLDGMARYAIPSVNALGVSMSNMKLLAKQLGRNHALALALWDTGWYETRTLAALIDEPALVTSDQMERWCDQFDNWAICDTVCFALFDRTPHAWKKVEKWASRHDEFGKRAAFALLWALTVHDKSAEDDRFVLGLSLIERAADDERHFVKKGVNMALRAVGKRNRALNAAALATAQGLEASSNVHARWVGKHALRELTKIKQTKFLK